MSCLDMVAFEKKDPRSYNGPAGRNVRNKTVHAGSIVVPTESSEAAGSTLLSGRDRVRCNIRGDDHQCSITST